jgi:hypothetical protein
MSFSIKIPSDYLLSFEVGRPAGLGRLGTMVFLSFTGIATLNYAYI